MGENKAEHEAIIARIRRLILPPPDDLRSLQLRSDAVGELVDAYLTGDAEDRDTIRRLAKQCLTALWIFGSEMASWAVHARDLQSAFKGLIALGLENLGVDERDTLRVLSILFHSVEKLGGSAEEMVQRVLPLVPPEFARCLLEFHARPPAMKDIGLMGFQEGETAGEFEYHECDPF